MSRPRVHHKSQIQMCSEAVEMTNNTNIPKTTGKRSKISGAAISHCHRVALLFDSCVPIYERPLKPRLSSRGPRARVRRSVSSRMLATLSSMSKSELVTHDISFIGLFCNPVLSAPVACLVLCIGGYRLPSEEAVIVVFVVRILLVTPFARRIRHCLQLIWCPPNSEDIVGSDTGQLADMIVV